jgi:hypothetical protein
MKIIKKVLNEPPALKPLILRALILTAISSIALETKAELNIKTLNNWMISDFSPDSLMISKDNQPPREERSVIAFEVMRPFCIASNPVLMLPSMRGQFSDGDEVYGEMIVDKNKPQLMKLKKSFSFSENEDNGKEMNWFVLKDYPSFANSQKVILRFKTRTKLENTSFDTTGIREATYKAEQICESDTVIQKVSSMEKV